MNPIYEAAKKYFPYTQALRRDLHRYPEIGFQEFRTARIVADELGKLGYQVSTGIADTGVVGMIEGKRSGPTVLARFDMDALPVQEETGAGYASTIPGKMHACGHDGHVAIGLTTAHLLVDHLDQLAGKVKLVFQPAEEGLGGAERMAAAGILEGSDYALAMHLWNERPCGWIGMSPGPVMAASDVFNVKIRGRGGHGAMPQQTIDPIVAAAQIITAVQTIVSRNLSPFESAVVSVAMARAGEALNVIPPEAEFGGTMRTFEESTRQTVIRRFAELVNQISLAFGCQADISIRPWTRAVVNDEAVTRRVQASVYGILPDLNIDAHYRTTASEDMSVMLEQIPGCYFFVGSADPERGLNYGHHHPKFDFDEAALTNGSACMLAGIVELLKSEG